MFQILIFVTKWKTITITTTIPSIFNHHLYGKSGTVNSLQITIFNPHRDPAKSLLSPFLKQGNRYPEEVSNHLQTTQNK